MHVRCFHRTAHRSANARTHWPDGQCVLDSVLVRRRPSVAVGRRPSACHSALWQAGSQQAETWDESAVAPGHVAGSRRTQCRGRSVVRTRRVIAVAIELSACSRIKFWLHRPTAGRQHAHAHAQLTCPQRTRTLSWTRYRHVRHSLRIAGQSRCRLSPSLLVASSWFRPSTSPRTASRRPSSRGRRGCSSTCRCLGRASASGGRRRCAHGLGYRRKFHCQSPCGTGGVRGQARRACRRASHFGAC